MRALLPKKSASLSIEQAADVVVATVSLRRPACSASRRIRFAFGDERRRARRDDGSGRSSKGRILVVDDNRLVLATLADGLTRAGYDVFDADNGDDAILLAREHRPDLALLDIRMEGLSGFDVAQYLRDQCQMPFMFLSAFSDEQTVAQVKALGAVAYLVKPLDIKQIVPAVEAAFAQIEAARRRPPTPGGRGAAPSAPKAVDTSDRDGGRRPDASLLADRVEAGGGWRAGRSARRGLPSRPSCCWRGRAACRAGPPLGR